MSRIAAVLCRAPDAASGGFDDDLLLAALCMERGVDVTFVESLARIPEGSTDQVCLHGIRGPFILIGREDGEAVAEQLERLGVEGRLVPADSQKSEAAGPRPQRSIFHIRLGPAVELPSLTRRIHAIRNDVATKVTQIQIGSRGGGLPIVQNPKTQQSEEVKTTGLAAMPREPVGRRSVTEARSHESEAQLDDLLDELDGFV